MNCFICVSVLSVFISKSVECANILGFVPVPSHSHHVFFQPIWKELSLRGHNVTVYTTDPIRDRSLVNLTEIDLSIYYEIIKGIVKDVVNRSTTPYTSYVSVFDNVLMDFMEDYMGQPEIKEFLMDNDSTYDVVIMEPFPPLFYAIGHKFNCPVIEIFSLNPFVPNHNSIGNPIHPVFYPDIPLSYVKDLSFFERIYNTVQALKIIYYYEYNLLKRCDTFAKKYFGPNTPPLSVLSRNTSLTFINANPVLNIARPLALTTIPLNFVHIKPTKELPTDIKEFLDMATEGAIYMSLGSNVKSAYLTNNLIEIFKETFAELPYKVLWKWENDSFPGISGNVFLKKWFPQQDVLAHPNVRLFISQAGIQSTEEAIFHKVPIIAMPFITDQTYNSKRIEIIGIGKFLYPFSLTKEKFKETILEVIQDKRFQDKVTQVSRLSSDQPMVGVEKAVWWTEYIIRNKGAKHLRSPFLDAPFYQFYFLDLFAFLFITLFVIFFIAKILTFYKKIMFLSGVLLILSYILT